MAFGDPTWGSVQLRIMVFVYQRRMATLDELAKALARPSVDRGRTKRSAEWLTPKYLVEHDGRYQCTALGLLVASNVVQAAKDLELCRSIQSAVHRVPTAATYSPA